MALTGQEFPSKSLKMPHILAELEAVVHKAIALFHRVRRFAPKTKAFVNFLDFFSFLISGMVSSCYFNFDKAYYSGRKD